MRSSRCCCNSLWFDTSDSFLRRLHALQTTAARLVAFTRRREHITPVLRQLHVRQRIEFKLAVLVSKVRNGLFPQYLADDCQLPQPQLPAANDFSPPTSQRVRSKNSSNSERSIPHRCSVAVLRIWNNLPHLHLPDSRLTLQEIRPSLKTPQ